MAKPFNFTGREEFSRKDFEVKVDAKSHRLTIFLKQHLSLLKKYFGCDVMITAYRTTRSQRVELGLVDSLEASRKVEFTEFVDAEGVQFKVIVVEPGTKRIRAKVEGLKADAHKKLKKTKNRSLLPVLMANANEGLGGRFWKIAFTADNPTLLLARSKFKQGTSSANDLPFQALAWPAIIKDVLTHAFVVKAATGFPKWAEDWKTLAMKVLGVSEGAPEDEPAPKDMGVYLEKTEKWIDDVAAAFATKRGIAEISSEFKKGGLK